MLKKQELENIFKKKHPEGYKDIVKAVICILTGEDDSNEVPDPERITIIDDGDYQGTLLFVIGATGYQPNTYWYVKVNYGSCSGCDTLEDIRDYSDDLPTDEQIKDYMTLALHIIQGLKEMNEESI
jgi:hypothetical protein